MAIDRSMSLVQVAREIHKNAVDHGWWEGERDLDEIYALIHSEWSEALEEARAGRDDVWFACNECLLCDKVSRKECGRYDPAMVCVYRGAKPEGICVELIDGVIRILDYLGYKNDADEYADGTPDWYFEMLGEEGEEWTKDIQRLKFGGIVCMLHKETTEAYRAMQHSEDEAEADGLLEAATVVWAWIKGRGLDPMQLLIEKHEYNVTRPYKHGKAF